MLIDSRNNSVSIIFEQRIYLTNYIFKFCCIVMNKAKCLEITEKLISWPVCSPFIEMFNTPDYFELIKNPMSLSQVKSKLQSNKYESVQAWEDDINLIWSNVKTYKGNDSLYSCMADEAASWIQKKKSEIPQSQEEDLIDNDQKKIETYQASNKK